jgi:hypothetical protein
MRIVTVSLSIRLGKQGVRSEGSIDKKQMYHLLPMLARYCGGQNRQVCFWPSWHFWALLNSLPDYCVDIKYKQVNGQCFPALLNLSIFVLSKI